jgi:hypothetical protein
MNSEGLDFLHGDFLLELYFLPTSSFDISDVIKKWKQVQTFYIICLPFRTQFLKNLENLESRQYTRVLNDL